MDEADPQLLDALNDLRREIETLNSRISNLTQAVDELRGEMMMARESTEPG